MNRIQFISKPLTWFVAVLLAAFVAGCGGGGDTATVLNSDKAITSFTIGGTVGVINQTAKTIALTVPNGTVVTALVPTFTTTGGVVTAGTPAVVQISSTTANNFTTPKVYVVTAADSTTATYTVTVVVAASGAKAITTYSLAGVSGVITGTSISVTMPFGTNVTALVATFSSTGAGVPTIGGVNQVTAATPNNFTTPKAYLVTAADGTSVTYTVTVAVASNSAKALTAYSLAGVNGTITGTAISVTMPFGTNVTALAATFTSTGAGAPTIAGVNQLSASTVNNFTTPKAYLVTAADGTSVTYTVTVAVALNSAKALTAFSLVGVNGVITEPAHTITVTMPSGTNVTALVATFTSTGAGVPTIGGVSQNSATTPNNFTTPKAYLVTAADGTSVTYTVTVTVAPAASGPPAINLLSITTNNFVVLATTGISDANPVLGLITGNIGLSPAPGSAITVACSEMQGTSNIHASDATYAVVGFAGCAVPTSGLVAQAILDLGTAYTAASDPATPAGVGAANLNVLAGVLPAGTNFTPGTYTWGSNVNINGDITLTGGASDVWVFQVSGNLAIASGADVPTGVKVVLVGGAVPSNVFWQVAGASVTLGTYSTFNGNILTSPSTLIAIQTGAVLHGRALSGTAVTLDGSTVAP
ncbi:MAG: DUF3494 domain-containing protein [Sideroxydans sp.]|nr:DUF3494 domain-containing protein [Sideroxydans sp.]